jgi:hypothetical protein
MGCDYYIAKCLNIYYNDTDYLVVELERKRCYYYFQYDEDSDDYDDKINEYIKECLTPEMKPIIIYSSNSFNKVNSETKYKSLIENEINSYGKKWSEITKIIKVESRFERV